MNWSGAVHRGAVYTAYADKFASSRVDKPVDECWVQPWAGLCYNCKQNAGATARAQNNCKGNSLPITILAVGKQREPYYAAAMAEYQKRLSRYCKIKVLEVADEKEPENASPALIHKAMELEGSRLLNQIKPQDLVVALCIEGESPPTLDFASQIADWHDASTSVVFVIGGSNGLSRAVMDRADKKLSLSKLTFPHQLARVMLIEQVYRAYKISSGERYHK